MPCSIVTSFAIAITRARVRAVIYRVTLLRATRLRRHPRTPEVWGWVVLNVSIVVARAQTDVVARAQTEQVVTTAPTSDAGVCIRRPRSRYGIRGVESIWNRGGCPVPRSVTEGTSRYYLNLT